MSGWDDDYEDDLDEEGFDDDETGTRPCPYCRADIYEDAPSCPECGELIDWRAVSRSPWEGRPTWWIVMGLIGVIGTSLVLAGL